MIIILICFATSYLYYHTICITTLSVLPQAISTLFQHPSMLYFLMTIIVIIVTITIIIICSITSTEFQRPSMTMVYPNMRMYPPTISQASENIASELPSKSKSLSYSSSILISRIILLINILSSNSNPRILLSSILPYSSP